MTSAIERKLPRSAKLPDLSIDMNDNKSWSADAMPPSVEQVHALRPAVGTFRAQLAESWSPDTAYPGSIAPSHWFAGNPQGQCGVSSVWLAQELAREYSIASTFYLGSLIFDDAQAEDLLNHCWLEIPTEPGELVLDLTCDQARGFDREIVFDSKSVLDQAHIYYISRDRVDISDLPSDPVWPRYQKLLLNIAA
jgi:hypothetical protein